MEELEQEVLEEVLEPVEDEIVNDGEEPEVNEYEDRAKTMGWVPKEEFRGDEARWTDAESFVKTAESRLPVMKENYNRLETKYNQQAEEIKKLKDYQSHMGKVQYERAMSDLQAKQKEAVENADAESFEQIEKQKQELQSDYSPKESTPQVMPEVAEWKAKNAWFDTNPQLQKEALAIEQQILAQESLDMMDDPLKQPMTVGQRLDEVTNVIREKYAKKRPTPPKTADTRQTSPKTKLKKSWGDIAPEHKAAAEAQVKAGIVTKDEYIKDYFGE